jgi:hypothetical protein
MSTIFHLNPGHRQMSASSSSVSNELHSSETTSSGFEQGLKGADAISQRVFSAAERDLIIRDIIASEALEGNTILYDEAERAVQRALSRPVVDIF